MKCACGCGLPVRPGSTWRRGHYWKGQTGESSSAWAGGGKNPTVYSPDNPRAISSGNVHVLAKVIIVEKAMEKYLPAKAEIFHVDGDQKNIENDNLVVCQSRAYHYLVMKRRTALAATGDVHSKKCKRCGRWTLPGDLVKKKTGWAHEKRCKNYL